MKLIKFMRLLNTLIRHKINVPTNIKELQPVKNTYTIQQ